MTKQFIAEIDASEVSKRIRESVAEPHGLTIQINRIRGGTRITINGREEDVDYVADQLVAIGVIV